MKRETQCEENAMPAPEAPGMSRRSFMGLGAAGLVAAAGLAVPTVLTGCSMQLTSAGAVTTNENAKFDLLIKGGNVMDVGEGVDLGIKDDVIAEVGVLSEDDAAEVIDATGKFVSPAFVDSHTHLDKAFQMENADYRAKVKELEVAFYANPDQTDYGYPVCGNSEEWLMKQLSAGMSDDEVKELIKGRITRALDMAIVNGTSAIKSNNTWGTLGVEAMAEVKEEYADKIDLMPVVIFTDQENKEGNSTHYQPSDDAHTAMTYEQLSDFCDNGMVDFVGGYFNGTYNLPTIDNLFKFADGKGLPIDLHVLETDVPLLDPLDRILDNSLSYGFGERLTCGHLTALDAAGIGQDAVKTIVEKAAQAKMNATSLCACNLYLMGRKAQHPIRRGITRLDLFLESGVNACFASDNIRDAWRPYGNADMLQEALICAHAMQYAFPEELETVFRMGTVNPAKNALIEHYGAGKGCTANLVVFDAATADEAVLTQAAKLYVLHNGAVVAKDGELV